MANKNSLLKSLSTVLLTRDLVGGGSTTLNGAVAKGASVITLTSATNFSIGDTIRVGSGSQTELVVLVAGQTSPSFATAEPLGKAHLTGEVAVEQTAYDLGDITDAGVDAAVSREQSDVVVATRRLVYTILRGYGDIDAGFTLPGLSIENLAFALGIPITAVVGTGVSSVDPKSLVTDLNNISTEQNTSLICLGVMMDGTPVRVELWGADPDYTALSINLRRGSLAGVPARFIATAGGKISNNASAYVANTQYRAGKGKVFDALSEVGVFADETVTPANTTIAAPSGGSNVKGARLISVVAATNMAVGDWLRLGAIGSDTVEFHRIASIAALQISLDTPLLRDQAVGAVVVEQKLVPFANISPDGVTLAFTGAVDRIREATQVLTIGTRPGTARAAVSFGLLDWVVSALARAVGVNPASLTGNQLIVDSTMGTAITDGVYIRGVGQDGQNVWLLLWGVAQDITRAALSLISSGAPSAVPTSWIPASGIAFVNHA
jgi:hypothetical protein